MATWIKHNGLKMFLLCVDMNVSSPLYDKQPVYLPQFLKRPVFFFLLFMKIAFEKLFSTLTGTCGAMYPTNPSPHAVLNYGLCHIFLGIC